MEENQKRAENLAARENKDTQNAVYDKTQNQLIDFEDIMMGDYAVVKKLKNLTEFGITEEQIKALFMMSSEFSIGASLDTALEELEKVFLVIANRLTNAPNGLVIDIATGKEDEVLSRIQCNELNIEYGDFREMPVAKKEEFIVDLIATITGADFNKSANEYNELFYQDFVNKFSDELYGDFEFENEKVPTKDDWKEFYQNMEFTKEEKNNFERKRKNSLIETDSEKETIILCFEYEELLRNNATKEELAEKMAEIRQYVVEHPESKFYSSLISIDGNGNSRLNNIIKFKDRVMKDRDEVKITEKFQKFEKLLGKRNFNELEFEEKSDLVRLIGEAFAFDNNSSTQVGKLCEKFCQSHGVEYSFESIKQMLLEVNGIEINSVEDIREHCSQATTIDNYRDRFSKMQNVGEYETADELKNNSKVYIAQNKQMIYKLLEEKMKGKNNQEKVIIMMSLYKEYRTRSRRDENSNDLTLSIISDYIKENRDFFEGYLDVDTIFTKNGRDLSIQKIARLLRNSDIAKNDDEIQFTNEVMSSIDTLMSQFKKFKEIESENLAAISKMIADFKTKPSEEIENNLIEKLEKVHSLVMDEKMLQALQGLNSAKVNEVLDKRFETKDKVEGNKIFGITYQSVPQRVAFFNLNRRLEVNPETGKDSRALEVIKLYQRFVKVGDEIGAEAVSQYIELQPEYFEKYFQNYKEGTIFDENGKVDIDKINSILAYIKFDKVSQDNINDLYKIISKTTRKVQETRRENAQEYKKLDEYIEDKNIDEISKMLNTRVRSGLSLEQIIQLRKLKSPEINAKLDILITNEEQYKPNISYNEEIKNLSPDMKKIVLMEARVQNAKGTPLFDKLVSERNKLYKENPEYTQMSLGIRTALGELTKDGAEMIKNYTNLLIDRTIEKNISESDIRNMTPEAKRKYTETLFMGIIDGNYSLRKKSFKHLQEIYGDEIDFNGEEKIEQIATKIYNSNNGKQVTPGEFSKEIKLMRRNLGRKLVKQEYFKSQSLSERIEKIDGISNEDFDAIFNDRYEELVDTAIDFKQDPLQNYFKDSRVDFSEADVQSYNDLYAKTTVDSWIDNRRDLEKLNYGSLLLLREKVMKNPELGEMTLSLKMIDYEIRSCESNLELKESLEETSISDLKKEAEKYEELKTVSKLLKDFSIQSNEQVPYENLTREKKIDYIEGILIAQNRLEQTSDEKTKKVLTQIINRKLEVMSNNDVRYITFDEKGNGTINEKALFDEYKQFNRESAKNYSELKDRFGKIYGHDYALQKLAEYRGNSDEEFVLIDRKQTMSEQLEEIEQARFMKNQGASLEQSSIDELVSKIQREEAEKERKSGKGIFVENIEVTEGIQRQGNQAMGLDNEMADNKSEINGYADLENGYVDIGKEILEKSQEANNYENKTESFLDKVKNTINRFMQPKATDGNEEKGRISKIIDGIKNIFSKNSEQNRLPEPKSYKDMLTNNMNQYIVNQVPTLSTDVLRNSSNKAMNNRGMQDDKLAEEEMEV